MSLFAYTPLVAATDFVGVQTDVQTVATGVVGVMLVIVGLGLIVRALTR